MKVIVDSHIPYLDGSLSPYASVVTLQPSEITDQAVRDANCIIIRTRTHVDSALLSGSQVKLVLTATIGFDHIDTAYCEANGIAWHNCPGCNAQGVCDYVESALNALSLSLPNLTLGIVGVGHVGRLVEKMAMRRGMNVVICDPFRAELETTSVEGHPFVSLAEIAQAADIITFHTPLTRDGAYPTFHLCDAAFLSACRPGAVIINAARGGIVDEEALLASGNPAIIDCWENEPAINRSMLQQARIATMHIAGYTRLGKYRASEMVIEQFNRFFGTEARLSQPNTFPESQCFDIEAISRSLKAQPALFEALREQYPLR